MPVIKPNQARALRWYLKQNNYKPQLSTHPVYHFTDVEGNNHTENIVTIMQLYENRKKNGGKKDELS